MINKHVYQGIGESSTRALYKVRFDYSPSVHTNTALTTPIAHSLDPSPLMSTLTGTYTAYTYETSTNTLTTLSTAQVLHRPPGKGEITLRVCATALNPGEIQLAGAAGFNRLVLDWIGKATAKTHKAVAGKVPGSDVSGVVVAVGAGVDKWKVGDEVFGFCFSLVRRLCSFHPPRIHLQLPNFGVQRRGTVPTKSILLYRRPLRSSPSHQTFPMQKPRVCRWCFLHRIVRWYCEGASIGAQTSTLARQAPLQNIRILFADREGSYK
jgi:hypothetical protein